MATDNKQLYETFVQKNGLRKGQSYKIKRGKSGLAVRIYESGDTAAVKPKRGYLGRKIGF